MKKMMKERSASQGTDLECRKNSLTSMLFRGLVQDQMQARRNLRTERVIRIVWMTWAMITWGWMGIRPLWELILLPHSLKRHLHNFKTSCKQRRLEVLKTIMLLSNFLDCRLRRMEASRSSAASPNFTKDQPATSLLFFRTRKVAVSPTVKVQHI